MQGQKLQELRKKLRLSQEEMASETSITYRAYTSYERGDRKPSFEFLENLVEKYNVNLNWLIADKGEMFITGKENQTAQYEDVKASILEEVKIMLRDEGLIK